MPRDFSGEIPVERRFPLHLEPSIGSIRELYDAAKQSRWDPERDIPWARFEPSRYSPEVLKAARLTWSRKAWTEYGGLPETPALIIRFCLERERESDPKYYLTVRNTEEAWHLDCCHRFAELCGGYIDEPASPAYRALFNQGLHREALDASRHLDAYVAAHIGIQDGLDLELTRLHRDNAADPVARDPRPARRRQDPPRRVRLALPRTPRRAVDRRGPRPDRSRDRARHRRCRTRRLPLRLARRRRRHRRGRPPHRQSRPRRRDARRGGAGAAALSG